MFRRLTCLSVLRWKEELLYWAHSIEPVTISRRKKKHKAGYMNQGEQKPPAGVKVKREEFCLAGYKAVACRLHHHGRRISQA
jgi:hypothetical protein